MNTTKLEMPVEKIGEFCRRHGITELSLFGSVLRDDFGDDSDIDVLVTFAPNTQLRFADLLQMEEELQVMFGRKVDLVQRKSVEQSENYIRRKHILDSLMPIYVAG